MTQCPAHQFLLVLPHLHVQNANAVSSPLTHGFPAITAFLGLMWALERKVRAQGRQISFKAVGVVCHDHQEQIVKSGFVGSFCLTRNPIEKDGSTAAIVEEGRIHLDISLIFAVDCPHWITEPDARADDIQSIALILSDMRVAGGTLLPPDNPSHPRYKPYVIDQSGDEDQRSKQFFQARRRMLPGYTLVSRDDLLKSRLEELQTLHPEATPLDAWLSLARINWRFVPDPKLQPPSGEQANQEYPHSSADTPSTSVETEKAPKGEWQHDRKNLGWIVPIPVGYGALSEIHAPGSVANARDQRSPFRFVESVYSIGQWLSPHRLSSAEELLWYADSQTENGLYRCRNDFTRSFDLLDLHYDFD